MQRVVVIGGLGFIGKHLLKSLQMGDYEIYCIDKKKINLKQKKEFSKIKFIKINLEEIEKIETDFFKDSIVYHLAAFAKPTLAEKQPIKCFRDNILGVYALARVLSKKKPTRLIAISAGALYAESREPYAETSKIDPFSGVYAFSKRAMEHALNDLALFYSVPTIIVRLFNTYGPGQEGEYLIPSLILKAAKGNFEIYNGSIVRDFNYVDDVVRILRKLEFYKGEHNIFNIGTGIGTSINQIAEIIGELLNVSYKDMKLETFGPKHQIVNNTRLKFELKFENKYGIKEGVKLTYPSIIREKK